MITVYDVFYVGIIPYFSCTAILIDKSKPEPKKLIGNFITNSFGIDACAHPVDYVDNLKTIRGLSKRHLQNLMPAYHCSALRVLGK